MTEKEIHLARAQSYFTEYHKMTNKPQVKIVNCSTGVETIEDATKEQIEEFAQIAKQKTAAQNETEAKATAKAALLEKLGITAEEAQLLLS